MGLTAKSTGTGALDDALNIQKEHPSDKIIALAGNPNVGKSTVFNYLTGMNQHTGNWPGKTVAIAHGRHTFHQTGYILVDLPGTYSLMTHSSEEEIARDFLLYEQPDAAIVVCDGTCLERNLNLVLQTMEITPNVVVCVNLMDEAAKRGIFVDVQKLQRMLGIPVVASNARKGQGMPDLMAQVEKITSGKMKTFPRKVHYGDLLEEKLVRLEALTAKYCKDQLNSRFAALHLLAKDTELTTDMEAYLSCKFSEDEDIVSLLDEVTEDQETLHDHIVSSIVMSAEGIWGKTVKCENLQKNERDRKLDRFLINKRTGIPIMLLLLFFIFWFTISGADLPSDLLFDGLFWIGDKISLFFLWIGVPALIHDILIEGVYKVLAWVVAVMLPPMAIFFPLFTLLEDFGYLPRIAFNLDHHFRKAKTCGKQALTMCMGFGCNAAGVVGCRIIDSPRERLIAILTNNFVPCNGRYPTLIAIITMFFVTGMTGIAGSLLSALLLTGLIVLGVILTFIVSRFLSETLLKGQPSSFTLELPPYRTPQIGKILVRSLFDRTLFVLGRAIVVAAPAGLVIWILANISIGDVSLLLHCAGFLDPFARLLGMDGIILMAFILGFPANEIVVPIMIMAYMASGTLVNLDDLSLLKNLLLDNGWTWVTAVSTMLFCLIHWPCSTTCMTIQKESGHWKWTLLSIALPTLIGMFICFAFTTVVRLLGLG